VAEPEKNGYMRLHDLSLRLVVPDWTPIML